MTYHVALLIEEALEAKDVHDIVGLHEGLDDDVHYHLFMPVDDAAAKVEHSLMLMAPAEGMGGAAALNELDLDKIRADCTEAARKDLAATRELFHSELEDAQLTGNCIEGSPIDALQVAVRDEGIAEVVIVTRPHVVKEFFHLDWTSQARRSLGVPVLHLLEHSEQV